MNRHKFLSLLLSIAVLASLVGSYSGVTAAPTIPTDETKVPHYFGPNPNWANSPFTLPDAVVTIDPPNQAGIQAEAIATVGANGVITSITVTNPGDGYTSKPQVTITGSGTGANASAEIAKKGVVIAITVDPLDPGGGYTTPVVTISGGSAAVDATATAYGGVDNVVLISGGSGYTFPTVDFDLPDDPNGVQATGHAVMDAGGIITGVVVDSPGSGYSKAPGVVIRDGTLFDPIAGAILAEAVATLSIQNVVLDSFGVDYKSVPTVIINDAAVPPTTNLATATATVDTGGVTLITVTNGGSGYVTQDGIKKFTDPLPGLCAPPGCPSYLTDPAAKYIPLGVADTSNPYPVAGGPAREPSDTYEIAVVQYRMSFSSSLKDSLGAPVGTLVRGYVQLETPANAAVSQHFPLYNEMLDGTQMPIMKPDGTQYLGVTPPQYLGPTIVASKDKPVRIVFRNLLPTDMGGDLFLPVDSTIMGSGEANMDMPYDPTPTTGGTVTDTIRNPMCTEPWMPGMMCFPKNRATLHLHGGNTPWISDGTVHQWITPANETTMWPEGVSVENVPDMDLCGPAEDGCQTFYYTNQQSARLMFYHDHSWGITRLNVYSGEAAGYLITDATEQALINGGALNGLGYGIPLVVQDKTFVPSDAQLYNQYDPLTGKVTSYGQDPTWDAARWGGYGNFWYHHVYMPAQNPGDPGGMSAFGRWMYGPWFWPPAGDAKHGPIANPYFNMDPEGTDGIRGTADDWQTPLATPCSLDIQDTWQYDTDPFCEPELIPGTPNISAGMEQFNDTPIVNGTAYPTLTVEPKSYRFRILSAANDRFFNFQWYVADPSTASTSLNSLGQVIGGTEVALNETELAAAQTDPVVFPTPDTVGEAGDLSFSLPGPDWIQIGTEGGFLPAPVVVDGQQVTTWITDPTRFDVGNVDQHSLVLAPAERADVIVDFSRFAGQTLILYNDAPAAFPARIPSYDYYTGAPDLSPVGAPTILPGYGPNTRTIMQVKVAGTPAPAFNLTALRNAFSHKANGSGVFESSQHPIIVGQATYNSAYGTSFAASGWCNSPTSTVKCDGFARISQQGGDPFTFDTLRMNANGSYPAGFGKVSIKMEPKAIHDETNASNFDEFGRMQANLGVEVVPATPGLQNVVLHPFVFPTTEIIDTTNLPTADVKVTPIATADGSQIWKITHNGVDTHPIHFHAYDVQILNRVTWDNIIIPPDLTELGWKDTIRVSPLEDTIIALRPVIPKLPFDLPNSVRLLSMMMPDGAEIAKSSLADQLGLGMTAFAPNGDPIDVYNHYVNFGAEYVYHCHILSHEEMDMMRPVSLAFPPVAPSGLAFDPLTKTLSWTDNSLSETAFVVEKSVDGGVNWTPLETVNRLLFDPVTGVPLLNTTGGLVSVTDLSWVSGNQYRVLAQNTVGDTWDYSNPALNEIPPGTFAFPVVTTKSGYATITASASPPLPPSGLSATNVAHASLTLNWVDNSLDEAGFNVQMATDIAFTQNLQTFPVGANVTTLDFTGLTPSTTYYFQVEAFNVAGPSGWSAALTVPTLPEPAPTAPSGLSATNVAQTSLTLNWVDNSNNETGFNVQMATDSAFTQNLQTFPVGANVTTLDFTGLTPNTTYYFQVEAFNLIGPSGWSAPLQVTTLVPVPSAPSGLSATNVTQTSLTLNWVDNSLDEAGFNVQMATDIAFSQNLQTFPVGANVTTLDFTGLTPSTTYYFQVEAFNAGGPSGWSAALAVPTLAPLTPPLAPSTLTTANVTQTTLTLNWVDNSNNEQGFTVQIALNNSFTSGLVPFTAGANATSLNFTGLTPGMKYYFRVQAFNAAGVSAWAEAINVRTLR